MTQVVGLCSNCQARFKINNVERLDGKTIKCPKCGHGIRIRAPKKVARAESEELEIVDDESFGQGMDFGAGGDEVAGAAEEESDVPAYRPARRPGAKKKKKQSDDSGAQAAGKKGKTSDPKKKQSPMMLVGAIGGGLLLMGLVVGGLIFFRQSGFGKPAKFVPPEKYVAMRPGIQPLSGQVPEGWEQNYGGGISGVPISARISDRGSISIDLRETVGNTAKGKMMATIKSGGDVTATSFGGGPAPVNSHDFHKNVVMKDFAVYEEGPTRTIATEGFGDASISDFSGKEGMLGSPVKGCRVTLIDEEHQYSVVCKCPPAQFEDVKPVFEKIIASMGTGEAANRKKKF